MDAQARLALLAKSLDADEPLHVQRAEALADVVEEDRTARFIASDASVDRYGDVIEPRGWDLANFRRNPVFLWMHSQYQPIGTIKKIGLEDGALMATVRFYDPGDSKIADDLWRLVKKKKLRAVSVGFTVKGAEDYEYIRDDTDRVTGIRYLRQELLELSLVSVPANPNALQVARSMGLPDELIRQALPLDASISEQHLAMRRRASALRLAGITKAAPR
jgi:HK97 family phage prohead protease